jgi:hypothetical protein
LGIFRTDGTLSTSFLEICITLKNRRISKENKKVTILRVRILNVREREKIDKFDELVLPLQEG